MQNPNSSDESSDMGKFLKLGTPTIFNCYFCPQTFSTKQALGGHQNAHREERQKFRRHIANERARLSKNWAISNNASSDTALSLASPSLPAQSLGSGPRGGFRPRHGIRFEPYLNTLNQCYRHVDPDIAWFWKDGLAPSLGESSNNSTAVNVNKFPKWSKQSEKGGNYEDVNTELTL